MAAISLLPLAVIHQNGIYRNHILKITTNKVELTPFEGECEATRFISAVIIVANQNVASFLDKLPKIGESYSNLPELAEFIASNNLYINKEEPTLVSASPSGYQIIELEYPNY